MKEEYRNIKGYPGYKVSNLGNVKSFKLGKERVLKRSKDAGGYLNVGLSKNGMTLTRTIHQLVAVAFLNHAPSGYKLVVNHKNFNKLDNSVNNLEVVPQRENANRKHIKSSSKHTGVCWDKANNKWRSYIRINGKLKHLGVFECELAAAKSYTDKLKTL